MASDNKTPADIVREMRGYYVTSGLHDGDRINVTDAHHAMLEFADRLEAEWKREVGVAKMETTTGDTKRMREALRRARLFAGCCPMPFVETAMGVVNRDKLCDELDAALSAPPRNCDVGTAEEQDNRMDVYCQTRKCGNCPLWDNVNNGVRCEFTWAQMPYAKGGAA